MPEHPAVNAACLAYQAKNNTGEGPVDRGCPGVSGRPQMPLQGLHVPPDHRSGESLRGGLFPELPGCSFQKVGQALSCSFLVETCPGGLFQRQVKQGHGIIGHHDTLFTKTAFCLFTNHKDHNRA